MASTPCHICGSTERAHLLGVASGRADIDHERRRDEHRTNNAMARATGKYGAVPGAGDANQREGDWWIGYYHGRRAEQLDLVSVAEIAREAQVTPDAVHKWRERYEDFPPPEATLAAAPVWRWSEVAYWLRRTGRGIAPEALLRARERLDRAVQAYVQARSQLNPPRASEPVGEPEIRDLTVVTDAIRDAEAEVEEAHRQCVMLADVYGFPRPKWPRELPQRDA